ncbi:MAG: anaerobic C4-dicarboxylate transporter [Amoebophilaceae bacterium]|nr:anaerobic C4-dicarboxylate transporter [Amoebophilaceae bacterium]
MLWIQMTIVLLAIFLGARLQGISLGIMGGLGLAILAFIFQVKPTDPPTEVLMIVTAVVTASSTLEAAGGLRYLTTLAERFIRRYPHRITFLSPLIVYLFTLLGGTGHTLYAILPVIADVAKDVGVRPSRPLSMAVIAAQQAVLASPISAPIALVVGLFAPYGIGLIDILKVCVPATFGGVLLATLVVNKWGKELHEDPAYLRRVQGAQQKAEAQTVKTDPVPSTAKRSVTLFALGITIVMLCGVWKGLRPSWEIDGTRQPMAMSVVIEIMMLSIAALIVLLCKLDPKEIVKSNVFSSGIQAVIAILGISWLGDTFITTNKEEILVAVQAQITQKPWQFSLLLFLMSILLVSQTATIRAVIPLGIALGLPAPALLAALPAVNGLFFIPNYPTLLAAISLDSTGTTRVGKFVLNHSFMIPGLVATTTAVVIAGALVKLFF